MLTLDTFAPLLYQPFELESAEGLRLPLVLTECTPLHSAGPQPGFSLIFESAVQSHWPQGNYRLHHATLPAEVLFLVPIGPMPASRQMRYQAVFG